MSATNASATASSLSPVNFILPLTSGSFLQIEPDAISYVKNNRQKIIPFTRIIGADAVPILRKPSKSLFSSTATTSSSSSSSSIITLRIAELYEPRHFLRQNYRTGRIERRLRIHTFACVCPLTEADKAVYLVRTLTLGPIQRAKHIFVILNPHSGNHKAVEIFETRIAPLFEFAGLHYTVTITDHAGHAIELGKRYNPQKYEGVVFISGDGLVQEFVSGLLTRYDWRTLVRRVPICSIACGTANALAVGLRTTNPEYAAQCVIKRKLRPLDALLVSNGNGLRTVSLCGVGWGIAGDIAIRSEAYRFLGTARYNILKLGLGASIFFGRTIHHATIDYSADIAMDDVALAAYFAQPIVSETERIEDWKHKRWLSVLHKGTETNPGTDNGSRTDSKDRGKSQPQRYGTFIVPKTQNHAELMKNNDVNDTLSDDHSNVVDASLARHRLLQSIVNPLQPDTVSNGTKGSGSDTIPDNSDRFRPPSPYSSHHSRLPTYQVPPEDRVANLRVSRSALEMFTGSNVDEITNAARMAVMKTGGRPVKGGIGHILGRDSMDLDAKTLAAAAMTGKMSTKTSVGSPSLAEHGLGITNVSAPSVQVVAELSNPNVQTSAVSQAGSDTPLSSYPRANSVTSSIEKDARAIIVEQEKALDESLVHPHGTKGERNDRTVVQSPSAFDAHLAVPIANVPPSTLVPPEALPPSEPKEILLGNRADGNATDDLRIPVRPEPTVATEPKPKHHELTPGLGFGVLVPCGRSCNICRAQGRLRYLGHWREAVVLSTLEPRTPPAPRRVFSTTGEPVTVQLSDEGDNDKLLRMHNAPSFTTVPVKPMAPFETVRRESIFRPPSPLRREVQPFTPASSAVSSSVPNTTVHVSHLQVRIPPANDDDHPAYMNRRDPSFLPSMLPASSPSQASETSHLCYDQPPNQPGDERFYSTEGSWATPLPTHKELSFHHRPQKSHSLPSALRAFRSPNKNGNTALTASSTLLPKEEQGSSSSSFFTRYSRPFTRSTAQPKAQSTGETVSAALPMMTTSEITILTPTETNATLSSATRYPGRPEEATAEETADTTNDDITTAPVVRPLPVQSTWGRAVRRLSQTMGIASAPPSTVPSIVAVPPVGPEPQHVWQHIELVPTTVSTSPTTEDAEEEIEYTAPSAASADVAPVKHQTHLSVTRRGFEKRHEGGQYVTVACVNTGKDGAYTHPSDGYVDLIIARRGGLVPTMGLLLRYVFAGVCGLGDERSSPLYDYVKCRSIVLTPSPMLGPDVCLNVDGEVLPGPAPFRIHLLPSLLTAYGEY